MNRKRKMAGAISLGFLSFATGAQAQFFSGGFLTEVFFPGDFTPFPQEPSFPEVGSDHEESYERFFDIFQSRMDDQFGSLAPDIRSILQSSQGSLGIADTHTAEDSLRSLLEQIYGEFDLDIPPTTMQVEEYSKQINREQMGARAHAVLGQAGQEAIRWNLEQIEDDVFAVGQLSDLAQGDIATQDVTKRLASQLAINSQLLGALYSEAIDGRVDTQLQAEILVDLSQALATEQKRNVRQELTTTAGVFTAASQVMLSITPSDDTQELWGGEL